MREGGKGRSDGIYMYIVDKMEEETRGRRRRKRRKKRGRTEEK